MKKIHSMPQIESFIRLTLGCSALGLALLLGACGQKGDLYVPEKPAALISSPISQ